MGAKQATFCIDVLKLIFNGTAIANLADNAASAPNTNLYCSLHTADPTSGNQSTSETPYTGYARVAVSRSTTGWTAANPTLNVAAINFNTCTNTGSTIGWVGIGTTNSGTGKLLYSGSLTTQLYVTNGVMPSFAIGALGVTEA
jgi:hypothetical protein